MKYGKDFSFELYLFLIDKNIQFNNDCCEGSIERNGYKNSETYC